MAVNFTAAQAAAIILEGTDKAAMMDIGSRFPLFAIAVAGNVQEVLKALPEIVTARKIESVMKEGVEKLVDPPVEVPAETVAETTASAAKATKAAKAAKAAKTEVEEPVVGEYAGKKAKELYGICKERGIETETKQKASVYVALLEENDAAPPEGDDDWNI